MKNIIGLKNLGGQGHPLVLFHGWGFDSQVWQPLVQNLQKHFEVYTVDLPGFGTTPLIDWTQFNQLLLNSLPPQFAVLGWSMGGAYAIRLASEYPQRVSHLIGVGTSPKFIQEPNWPGIEENVFDSFMKQFTLNPVKTLETFVKTQTGKTVVVNPSRLPSLASLEHGLNFLKTCDLRDALNRVKHSCFIFGRLDAIVPARTCLEMQIRYPQFNYIMFEKAAHMPFISDQARFITNVKSHIDKM